MTSCPDKPTASVIGWLCLGLALLGQACSGPASAPDRSLLPRHEKRERFVRLEARWRDRISARVSQFSHTLWWSPSVWAWVLSGVRIQIRKDCITLTRAKDTP